MGTRLRRQGTAQRAGGRGCGQARVRSTCSMRGPAEPGARAPARTPPCLLRTSPGHARALTRAHCRRDCASWVERVDEMHADFSACRATRRTPFPSTCTSHLRIVAGLWLAAVPW